jgi:hypothetical protein
MISKPRYRNDYGYNPQSDYEKQNNGNDYYDYNQLSKYEPENAHDNKL